MINSSKAITLNLRVLLPYFRVYAVIVVGSILGACSTVEAVSDGVVDAAKSINPLNWIDDEDEKSIAKPDSPDGNKNNKEEDIRAVAEAVEVTGRSDAKRKSRSGKNPSSMLYGDNRINKSYPKLGNIPDRPTADAALRRRIENKRLADGLVADSKNAEYTDKELRKRSFVNPPPPIAVPVSTVEARGVSPAIADKSSSVDQKPKMIMAPTVLDKAAGGQAHTKTVGTISVPKPTASRVSVSDGTKKSSASSVVVPNQKSERNTSGLTRSKTPVSAVTPPPPRVNGQKGQKRFATPVGVPETFPEVPKNSKRDLRPPPKPPLMTKDPTLLENKRRASPIANSYEVLASPPPQRNGPRSLQTIQVATIYFGNGSSRLEPRDVAVVHDVVKMFKETGGAIRIVGHSSGITASENSGRGKLVNFKVSLDRANSVAAELVRNGVPANYIDVAAHGADSPIFAEYSSTGAAGNRRAEIFLDFIQGM